MENIKEKLLEASRCLFLAQGYKNTTIRQILAKSGLQNGSLYHFFKNKEEIFMNLAYDLIDEGIMAGEKLIEKDLRPALKYAITLYLELYMVDKHELVSELYYEAYRSWTVFESLVKKSSERNKLLFKTYNPEFTDKDYYERTMTISGCIYSFVAERYNRRDISLQNKIVTLLEMSLSLFNVPKSEIKNVIKKSGKLIGKKKIVIYGFDI